MAELPKLGRLQSVDLRTVWLSEPYSFTPWLAQQDSLDLLAEALSLPGLELVSTEQSVSEFSVDIVARIAGTDDIVAIENQLEKSDHTHLGQCIAYAAGTEAKAVVWIVSEFKDGHRAALDWLNRKTTDDIAFFGVEVEAVRIGASEPAPLFHVVMKPNTWARTVREQTAEQSLSAQNLANLDYWGAFDVIASERGVPHGMAKLTKGNNYYHYLGESKSVGICAYVARGNQNVGVYTFNYGADALEAFDALLPQKSLIEAEYGSPLEWKSYKNGYWITAKLKPASPDDLSDWPRQHHWLAETMAKMKRVLAYRVAIETPPQ